MRVRGCFGYETVDGNMIFGDSGKGSCRDSGGLLGNLLGNLFGNFGGFGSRLNDFSGFWGFGDLAGVNGGSETCGDRYIDSRNMIGT